MSGPASASSARNNYPTGAPNNSSRAGPEVRSSHAGAARPVSIPQKAPVTLGAPVTHSTISPTTSYASVAARHEPEYGAGAAPAVPTPPTQKTTLEEASPGTISRITSTGQGPPPLGAVYRPGPPPLEPTGPSQRVSAPVPPATSRTSNEEVSRRVCEDTSRSARNEAQRPAPESKPRGLRKLFAMMTCSGSATNAAALDERPKHTATSRPPAEAKSSVPAPVVVAPPSEAPSSTPSSSSLVPQPPPTLDKSALTVPHPPAPGIALTPNRDSIIATNTTATHTDESDEFGSDIITSVSPNGPLMGALPFALDPAMEQEMYAEEQRLIQQGGTGIPLDEYGRPQPLLAQPALGSAARKCLVLDLDETLVHSSFKMVPNADFIVPVEIEGIVHNVYVIKRPGVDEFMRLMGRMYEIVVFTASLNKYADPVIDILDIHHVVSHRLFRESCYNHHGSFVKDLSQLGRPLHDTIILDNSPASYIFHPTNAVPVSSWFNDPHDTELTDLCPFLEDLCFVDDVRIVLNAFIEMGF